MKKREIDFTEMKIDKDGTISGKAYIQITAKEAKKLDPSQVMIKKSDLPRLAKIMRENGEIEFAERIEAYIKKEEDKIN